jgi:hypothetical protein
MVNKNINNKVLKKLFIRGFKKIHLKDSNDFLKIYN